MSHPVKIKVCGMREAANISSLVALKPDYIGFIFYPKSKRYLGEDYRLEAQIPDSIKRVGVFVNALMPEVLNNINRLKLDYVQLHGNESPEYCRELQLMHLKVIKAFGVDEAFDFEQLEEYDPYCDFFLFDTQTKEHGGSGRQFDWQLLKNYKLSKPVFLSGGIGPEDLPLLCEIKDLPLHAIDINSKFEDAPAEKNIEMLKDFIPQFRGAKMLV